MEYTSFSQYENESDDREDVKKSEVNEVVECEFCDCKVKRENYVGHIRAWHREEI